MASGVYKITSPKGRVYIGSSKNIDERLMYYEKLWCKSQPRLYNSLKKYGFEKHKVEIITECDIKDMLAIELHWGLFYNVLDAKAGLNSKLPKNGEEYRVVSEETRERMRQSSLGQIAWHKGKKTGIIPWNKGKKTGKPAWNRGLKTSDEQKRKLSEAMKGRKAHNKGVPMKQEVKDRLSKTMKGRPSPTKGVPTNEETKKKISLANKGKKAWNRGLKTNEPALNAKLVLDFETGVFYYSSREAAKSVSKYPVSSVQSMINGGRTNKTNLNLV